MDHKTTATHYVADFFEIENSYLLDNMDYCYQMLIIAVQLAGCGILNVYKHKFEPQGISITATLSESHCTIHTWPEKAYCAIDLYGCGRSDLSKGIQYFEECLKPKNTKITVLKRGHDEN